MVTTVTAGLSPACGPKLESLTYIDMTKLSQSELHTLSLCSNSAFDLHRTDDVVIPNIDRTVFNESAGGRRQTYSHLRGGFHRHHHHHHYTRITGLVSRPIAPPPSLDPENHSILHYLKHYLVHNSVSNCPPPPPPPPLSPPPPVLPSPPPLPGASAELEQSSALDLQEKMAIAVHAAVRKRKRGKKAKVKVNRRLMENGVEIELGRLNKKGEEVDFVFLESKGDELYSEELGRRTAGLETEEAVLDFLTGLEGQWCSRRKRRKHVDASDFGDALPVGWKLLLGIRRKEGRVFLYCRRIVSPTGEEFLSCEEVSSFLRSYFEGRIRNQPMDLGKNIVVASGSCAGLTYKEDGFNQEHGSDSMLACLTASGAQENEICLMGIDSLPDVQVQNVFECYKCKLTFEEEKAYLHHLMSYHQRTTRRYKFGGHVGEGVIIKDGKFECQFCHKVFLERRSYNGHVGVHVRTHSKVLEELPPPEAVHENKVSPSRDDLQPMTSKMNASVEVAQNSVMVTPNVGSNSETVELSCHSIMRSSEALAKDPNQGTNLCTNYTHMETEALQYDEAPFQVLNQCGSNCLAVDGEFIDGTNKHIVEANLKSISTDGFKHPNAKELGSPGNNETDIGFMYSSCKLNEDVGASKELIGEENITSSSVPPVELSDYFRAATNKGGDDFHSIEKKHEIVTVFEELGLDDMETFKYDFVDREEPSSLAGVSMDLHSHEAIGAGFDSSVGFGSDEIMLNMAGAHQLVTVCVWCRAEFKVETFDTEPQTDSIGYMCPTCKEKISGHFDSLCP